MGLKLEDFGIDRLSPEERAELIELIWDSLPDDAAVVPSDWQIRELEERIGDADANPSAGESWESVWDRLMRKP